jgi:hypothetical protein
MAIVRGSTGATREWRRAHCGSIAFSFLSKKNLR